ncbi:MAG: transposase [Pseudomonadota bacterium]
MLESRVNESGRAGQRKKLERLCRYITRPAIAQRRSSLAKNGNVVIALKTPYDDGTSHVVLSPMEIMGRLATLVPKPRVKLTGTPSRVFKGRFLQTANCVKTLFRRNP